MRLWRKAREEISILSGDVQTLADSTPENLQGTDRALRLESNADALCRAADAIAEGNYGEAVANLDQIE